MKKYRSLLFLAIILIIVCGLAIWLPRYINSLRLEQFAQNLYDYPLPPDTRILDGHAELGKVGNSNNCYYQAQQVMTTTLSSEEIEQYYEGVKLPRVSFGAQWDEMYDGATVTEIRLEFDKSQSNETKLFFTLSLFDVGFDTTLDFRCH